MVFMVVLAQAGHIVLYVVGSTNNSTSIHNTICSMINTAYKASLQFSTTPMYVLSICHWLNGGGTG